MAAGSLRGHPDRIFGRDAELTALDVAVQALDGGAATVVLAAAEPGLGKTTLLGVLRERADGRGILVLAGRSSPLGGGLAFAPVGGVLARYLDVLADGERAALIAGLPLLGRIVSGLPDVDLATDPEVTRTRLFQSVALLLARLSRDRPVLLVVDDVHWADPATVALLGFLADELASVPVGLALAYRPGDLAHRSDARHLLGDLARRTGTVALTLGPLGDDDLAAVAAAALGGPLSTRLAAGIVDRAAGVPLVADAVGRDLRARGAARRVGGVWDAEAATLDIPRYARDLFVERVERLAQPAPLVLAGLAVAEQSSTVEVAAVTGLEEASTVDAVRVLTDVGLARSVEPDEPGVDRHEVAHPLVAEAVLDRLAEAERRVLHARRARRLRLAGAPLDEIAAHVAAAGDAVDDGEAVTTLAAAGERALARGAGAEAIRWLSAAVERARCVDDPGRLGALLGAAGDAWELEGEVTAAAVAQREATDVLGGSDPAAASRSASRVAVLDWLRGVEDDVDWWGDHAVELANRAQPIDRLRAEYERCYMRFRRGRAGSADAAVGAFEQAAKAAGDHPDVAAARFAVDASRAFQDGERLEPLVAQFTSHRPEGTPAIQAAAAGLRLEILALLGRWSELEAHAAELTGWRATWARLDAALSTGRWEDADDLLTEEIHPASRGDLSKRTVELWLAAHRGDRSGVERLRQQVDGLLASAASGLRTYRASALATDLLAALALGDPVDPRRPLDGFDERWDAMREPLIRAGQGEWLAVAGRPDEARRVAARLRRYGGPSTRVGAIAARVEGLAVRADDRREAARVLHTAADAFDAVGMPFDAARCALDAAEVSSSAPTGVARDRLLAALATFERVGAAPFAERAHRRVGHPPARPDHRIRLTPREQRVAQLVANGCTNVEIAERLGISIRTVTSHLDHAYTKVGIGSRAALAAYVTRAPNGPT